MTYAHASLTMVPFIQLSLYWAQHFAAIDALGPFMHCWNNRLLNKARRLDYLTIKLLINLVMNQNDIQHARHDEPNFSLLGDYTVFFPAL
jgi:hypothetical protein